MNRLFQLRTAKFVKGQKVELEAQQSLNGLCGEIVFSTAVSKVKKLS